MKKILIIFSMLLASCVSNNTKIETDEEFKNLDSIIQESQKNLTSTSEASKRSDSSISEKVEKTVKQITTLKQEVKTLKQENNALKTQLNDNVSSGQPFKLLPVSDN